ncbi:hypothetical protein [Desulforamulus ruminis]|uniref:Uncharacterized protein n=1 Tax=Desulforamulus ruminis (strain ATCC 23193 / DSM 2154 / NCIMB 8452 / DL) TaxID=696281 RepID=F6DU42_DESRL|nr:hypothetical protein [Desulforamulus ruminis]AEG60117.1 hypothetical protein Desru_1856 [Desulforamulus ruminis DSM 2154]
MNFEMLKHYFTASLDSEKMNEYWRNAQTASELADTYPHLNKELVIYCTFLLPLVKQGIINIHNPRDVMDLFTEANWEQGLQVYHALIHSQGAFATGEARVAQHFWQ